jgi:hypothetical protein
VAKPLSLRSVCFDRGLIVTQYVRPFARGGLTYSIFYAAKRLLFAASVRHALIVLDLTLPLCRMPIFRPSLTTLTLLVSAGLTGLDWLARKWDDRLSSSVGPTSDLLCGAARARVVPGALLHNYGHCPRSHE